MGPREKHLFKMWRFECTYILREKTQQRGWAERHGRRVEVPEVSRRVAGINFANHFRSQFLLKQTNSWVEN